MYAIIKTGGNKQHRVSVGDVIDIDLLDNDTGSEVEFGEVLFAFDGSKAQIGKPHIPNFLVYGEVVGTAMGEKITSMKYKPSHNQQRKWGHRQRYARVKITAIGKKHKEKEGKHGS